MIELRPDGLTFSSRFHTDDTGQVYGYSLEDTAHLTLELHTPLGRAGNVTIDLTSDEQDILDQLLYTITERAKDTLNK